MDFIDPFTSGTSMEIINILSDQLKSVAENVLYSSNDLVTAIGPGILDHLLSEKGVLPNFFLMTIEIHFCSKFLRFMILGSFDPYPI